MLRLRGEVPWFDHLSIQSQNINDDNEELVCDLYLDC